VRLLLALPVDMTLVSREEWGSRSSQKGSSALYPAYWEMPWRGAGGGILLQLLSVPESREAVYTSRHYHRATVERFYPVYGEVEIRRGDGDWQSLDWRTEVPAGTSHQLRLRRGWSLTLLRMDGPCSVRGPDCMDDHHYD
jgi:hypothetical protein